MANVKGCKLTQQDRFRRAATIISQRRPPTPAPIVALVAAMMLEGLTYDAMSFRLQDAGWVTSSGKRFDRKHVQRIAKKINNDASDFFHKKRVDTLAKLWRLSEDYFDIEPILVEYRKSKNGVALTKAAKIGWVLPIPVSFWNGLTLERLQEQVVREWFAKHHDTLGNIFSKHGVGV